MLQFVKGPFMMQHDQRVIIRFLSNEEIADDEITTRLQAQFVEHAYKLRTVRFWIGEVQFGRQDLHDEIRTGRPPLDDIDAKFLAILNKSPFESARSIAERLRVSHAKVLNYLHLSIGFKSFHLHWVPHLLTEDLRRKRKDDARAMLTLLHPAQRHGWHYLVTGDKSWFSLIHHHVGCGLCRETMWPQNRDSKFRAKDYVQDYMESN
jgi:hypothetical protein